MSRRLIVANFKSNLDPAQAVKLVGQLDDLLWPKPGVEVVLAPTTLCLSAVAGRLDRRRLGLASQTGAADDYGPHTGEVSFAQLGGLVDYSLVGHSERRFLGETDDQIADKVRAAVYHRIVPIICVGETKTDRVNQETGRVLSRQTQTALANLTSTEAGRVVIAYEPVWALSDGQNYAGTKTPTPTEIAAAVSVIRQVAASQHGQKAGESIRCLYGGSVNSANVETFLVTPGLDGLLVGGASLEPFELASIVEAAGKDPAPTPKKTPKRTAASWADFEPRPAGK